MFTSIFRSVPSLLYPLPKSSSCDLASGPADGLYFEFHITSANGLSSVISMTTRFRRSGYFRISSFMQSGSRDTFAMELMEIWQSDGISALWSKSHRKGQPRSVVQTAEALPDAWPDSKPPGYFLKFRVSGRISSSYPYRLPSRQTIGCAANGTSSCSRRRLISSCLDKR